MHTAKYLKEKKNHHIVFSYNKKNHIVFLYIKQCNLPYVRRIWGVNTFSLCKQSPYPISETS